MHLGIAFTKRVPLPEPNASRWVIPDVHGCVRTLNALLEKINPSKNDQLFFLGDYINKGPDSNGVMETLLSLFHNQYQLYCLRGNHEQLLLNCSQNLDKLRRILALQQGLSLLDKNGKPNPEHLSFISEMPYYFQLQDFYLVHAGFKFSQESPLQDANSMLTIRRWHADQHHTEGRRVIHGHTPTELYFIEKNIAIKSLILPLDNGCVYAGDVSGQGYLLALNLDTMELLRQQNIDR